MSEQTDLPTEEVPIAEIDPTPANSVRDFGPPGRSRAKQEADAVKDYMRLYRGGNSKACHLHRGPTKQFLAEGGRRLKASLLAGRDTLLCKVWDHPTDEAAEVAAYRQAGPSNVEHGLRRSPADKRAALKALIVRPENAHLSDTELSRACGIRGHYLAGLIRHELSASGVLTGRASVTDPDRAKKYAKLAKVRPGYYRAMNGECKPVARPAAPSPPCPKPSPHIAPPDPPRLDTLHAEAREVLARLRSLVLALLNHPVHAGVVRTAAHRTGFEIKTDDEKDVRVLIPIRDNLSSPNVEYLGFSWGIFDVLKLVLGDHTFTLPASERAWVGK